MEKLQARKKVYLWLLILLSLCALIPLAVLSKYNHQSGDDYGYAYRTFQIWRETHSFWNVIKEAFATSASSIRSGRGFMHRRFCWRWNREFSATNITR